LVIYTFPFGDFGHQMLSGSRVPLEVYEQLIIRNKKYQSKVKKSTLDVAIQNGIHFFVGE
jgi:hypothetical protein